MELWKVTGLWGLWSNLWIKSSIVILLFEIIYLFIFMCMHHVCATVTESQLELEFQKVVRHHAGTGNWTCVLCKSSKYFPGSINRFIITRIIGKWWKLSKAGADWRGLFLCFPFCFLSDMRWAASSTIHHHDILFDLRSKPIYQVDLLCWGFWNLRQMFFPLNCVCQIFSRSDAKLPKMVLVSLHPTNKWVNE